MESLLNSIFLIMQGMCRKAYLLLLLVTLGLPLSYAQSGAWQAVPFGGNWAIKRHESAFVQAGDKFYMLGGRGNTRRVQAFDYSTGNWIDLAKLPKDPTTNITIEIHHVQPVELDGLIYFVGAFTGGYPNEIPIPKILIYDPVSDSWSFGADIPASRQRGSAGCVVYNGKIYLVCGIQNGHVNGWVNWVDMYDPATNSWTQLANAPQARDHFHAVLHNGKIFAVSGRRTGSDLTSVYGGTIDEMDVYDITTDTWSTEPAATGNIPTPRAGAMSGVLNHPLYGNILMVIGGESLAQVAAHAEFEAFDLTSNVWLPDVGGNPALPDMMVGRHGTQAIVSNGGVYMAAGASPDRGGGSEIDRF